MGLITTILSLVISFFTAAHLLASESLIRSNELPCEGIYNNPTDFQSFELRKDSTCISRTGFQPYNFQEQNCQLEYDKDQQFWFINNSSLGNIKFNSNCSEMTFRNRIFKSVTSLPVYESAPFPAPVDQQSSTSMPTNFSSIKNSIVKLGNGCTGTWLSNDGYLLTVMHCLLPELEYNGIGKIISEPEVIPSQFGIGYKGFKTTNFKPIRLKPVPNSKMNLVIDGIADYMPRLIALGTGALSHRPYFSPQGQWNITQQQFARTQMLINEYVILKYNLGVDGRLSCTPIRTEKLIEEELVWSVGFTNLLNSITNKDEKILASSQGKVYNTIESVRMVAPYLNPKKENYGVLNSENLVFSDARTSPGMSGGPLLDDQGRIVGITSFGIDKYFRDVSEQAGFVRVSTMYKELKSKLPENELNKIFECKATQKFSSFAPDLRQVACSPHKKISIKVVGKIERVERNFTQGLEFYNGSLFESTGAYNEPTKLNLIHSNGQHQVLSKSKQFGTFGEGLTILSNKIFQATWQDRLMFIFGLDGSYKQTLSLPFNGWGLTNDGKRLILTDGTAKLRFLNPSDLSVVKELQIRIENGMLPEVNELEWIKGKIFGNVFNTNTIVRIDPNSGCVDGVLDAKEILLQLPESELSYLQSNPDFVLNGIAYNSKTDEVYLTGKNWKYIFTVKFYE